MCVCVRVYVCVSVCVCVCMCVCRRQASLRRGVVYGMWKFNKIIDWEEGEGDELLVTF